MRRLAIKSRDATTQEERDEIWQEHGIRWSALWEIDYWDPTTMLPVDPMHNMAGLAMYECRSVLQLQMKRKKKPPKVEGVEPTKPEEFEDEEEAYIHDWEIYDCNNCPRHYRVVDEQIDDIYTLQALLVKPITTDFTYDELRHKLWRRHIQPLKFLTWSLDIVEEITHYGRTIPATTKNHYAGLLLEWVRACPL
jgi:hypothetical protein